MSEIYPDEFYMSRALQLAAKGLYTTDPNPRVGCVILQNNTIVGEGWHERAGQPHAEVNAIEAAGVKAKGATAFVTLEPCSHHGRTPPCADLLISAQIKHVVVAMEDPNPMVAGSGIKRLQEAGITVRCGVLREEAEQLNPGFIKRMTSGLPWVRVKLAASLDGRTAMASGESVWISSEASRRDVQFQRARASCILSGSRTVILDNPSLNVRLSAEELAIKGMVRQPVRVILDSRSRVPEQAKVFHLPGNYLVYTNLDLNKENNNIRNYINLNSSKISTEKINLSDLLADLAKREFNEVHVEAGPTLCGALLSQQLVDEVVLYSAPHIMGDSGNPLFHLPEIQQMKQRIEFKIKDLRRVGTDIRLTLIPDYR